METVKTHKFFIISYNSSPKLEAAYITKHAGTNYTVYKRHDINQFKIKDKKSERNSSNLWAFNNRKGFTLSQFNKNLCIIKLHQSNISNVNKTLRKKIPTSIKKGKKLFFQNLSNIWNF